MKAILSGHSRGLGAAIAAQLARRHIQTLALARHDNPEFANTADVEQVRLDLADTAALLAWLDEPQLGDFLRGAGTILLINNAATLDPIGPLQRQDPSAIAQAVALNVSAPLLLSSAICRIATPNSQVRILHISSGAARHPYPGWSVYCATKAALDQHARCVQLDTSPELRIASVAPGVIDTQMQAHIRASDVEDFPLRDKFDTLKREGQLLSAEQCAQHLVRYLLNPQFAQQPVSDLRTMLDTP